MNIEKLINSLPSAQRPIIHKLLSCTDMELNLTRRWEKGMAHHLKSKELVDFLMATDFVFNDDFFCFKRGGDGDNAEMLMYLLDLFFEFQERNNI